MLSMRQADDDIYHANDWINLDTHERDYPDAIKIDQEGYLIVAGQSYGSIDDYTLNNGLGMFTSANQAPTAKSSGKNL